MEDCNGGFLIVVLPRLSKLKSRNSKILEIIFENSKAGLPNSELENNYLSFDAYCESRYLLTPKGDLEEEGELSTSVKTENGLCPP